MVNYIFRLFYQSLAQCSEGVIYPLPPPHTISLAAIYLLDVVMFFLAHMLLGTLPATGEESRSFTFYNCILISRVISDMDDPGNRLMGAHGYCAQVQYAMHTGPYPLFRGRYCWLELLFHSQDSKFPLQPHQIYYITVWRTWLFIAYSDGRWLYYQFSLPHLYISL